MPNNLFDPELVIARLKIAGTPFRKVSGAADFAVAQEDLKSRDTLPAAYVIALGDRASKSEHNIVIQHNASLFGISIAVSNLRDQRGHQAAANLRTVRLWMLDTLLGWVPGAGYWPIEFSQGRLLMLSEAILWWQDDYATALTLRQEI